MFPEVWERVVGHKSEGTKGKLSGFSTFRVRGQGYPGLMETGPETATNGVLYRDLSEEDWVKLDDFEDKYQVRVIATKESKNTAPQKRLPSCPASP